MGSAPSSHSRTLDSSQFWNPSFPHSQRVLFSPGEGERGWEAVYRSSWEVIYMGRMC